MNKAEADIRALIEGWTRAVHAGDMEGMLANYVKDMVMFDVLPPSCRA